MKTLDEIIQENFSKFVVPTLLTMAEALIHPYNLEKLDLIYNADKQVWYLIVRGKSEYGEITNAKEIRVN